MSRKLKKDLEIIVRNLKNLNKIFKKIESNFGITIVGRFGNNIKKIFEKFFNKICGNVTEILEYRILKNI